MRNRIVVLSLGAFAMVGDVACSSQKPAIEEPQSVAQTSDHRPIYLTSTKSGKPSGAVIHHDGYDSRIRVTHDREFVSVMSNEEKPQRIDREWALSHMEFIERDKTVFSYVFGMEAVSRQFVLRAFSSGRELTCVFDFAHAASTGYGLMSRDLRVGGKSQDFAYAKWEQVSPTAPLACDIDAVFPVTQRLLAEWMPLFRAKFDVKHVSYNGVRGVESAYGDAGSSSSNGVRPQDWWWTDWGTPRDRIDIEIAIVAGAGAGLVGMKWGQGGGPETMLAGGLIGFGFGFLTTYVKLKQDEEKEFIKEHEKHRKEREKNGRGSQRGEPGGYREPRPSDVGWDGQSGGMERGSDGQGMGAGDIPSNTGAGQGTRGYPGGSGPSGPPGGAGGDCTENPDPGGNVAVANLRILKWCE